MNTEKLIEETQINQAVDGLCHKLATLEQAVHDFKAQAMADGDRPVYLPEPEFKALSATQQRQLAIESLCHLWHNDSQRPMPKTGLLSLSPASIAAAQQLNASKQAFKLHIKTMRQQFAQHKSIKNNGKLATLLDHLLAQAGLRDGPLKHAMQALNIQRLNLQRCYCQLRILPEHLESVSWTWANCHSEVQKISVGDAIDLCQALPDNHPTKPGALQILASMPVTEALAYKKDKNRQLRANISFYQNQLLQRKAVTVSGILLTGDDSLPRSRWPEESTQTRLTRLDQKIHSSALIPALHLYQYKALAKQKTEP